MQSEVKSISITVTKQEAFSVINALQMALQDFQFEGDDLEKKGAMDMLELLRGNFTDKKIGRDYVGN